MTSRHATRSAAIERYQQPTTHTIVIRFTNRKAKINLLKTGKQLCGINVFLNEYLTAMQEELTKTVKVNSYIVRYGLLKALYTSPPGRPVHSKAISTSGKHSATLQLLREDYSFTYRPLSVLPGTHLCS